MEKFDIIFYIFIIIFPMTAIITFLSLNTIIKTFRTRYLNAFFCCPGPRSGGRRDIPYNQIDFGCQEDERIAFLCKSVNDAGQFTQILIDEYATTIFLRKYLNLKYPLLP